jgi:hypothetical protein
MRGTLFALYMNETADEAAIIAQLAELNAIPGVQVVPFVPSNILDAVAE